MTSAADVAAVLEGSNRSGNYWMAKCPVRDDCDPSVRACLVDDAIHEMSERTDAKIRAVS